MQTLIHTKPPSTGKHTSAGQQRMVATRSKGKQARFDCSIVVGYGGQFPSTARARHTDDRPPPKTPHTDTPVKGGGGGGARPSSSRSMRITSRSANATGGAGGAAGEQKYDKVKAYVERVRELEK